MDSSVGSAIEKIKRIEQDKEAELKAKREFEATKAALERSIRDAHVQIKKLQQEHADLLKRTDDLRSQLTVQKIRRDVLVDQLKASTAELEKLRAEAGKGMSDLSEIRSNFCTAVQNVSNECDVWALLMRPTSKEPMRRTIEKTVDVNKQVLENEGRLKSAIERRNKAIVERNRLMTEPDNGEEFVRRFVKPRRFFSSKAEPNENEPIKFSTSPAAQPIVRPMVKGTPTDRMPWYQPYSVVGSLAVFLVYFCILREENDVDQEFNKTLYDRIKGLEKEQLLQAYRYNKENGKDVLDIEKRLKEIEVEEAKLLA